MQHGGPMPADQVQLASNICSDLLETNNSGGWAGVWANDRMQVGTHILSKSDSPNELRRFPDNLSTLHSL